MAVEVEAVALAVLSVAGRYDAADPHAPWLRPRAGSSRGWMCRTGRVLATITPPLNLGTGTLHTGPALGFISEAATGPSIIASGAWRSWPEV